MTMTPDLALLTFNPVPFFRPDVQSEQQTDRRAAQRENSARHAFSEHRLSTRGVGTLRVGAPMMFDVPFLSEPHFNSGMAVVRNPQPAVWSDPWGGIGFRSWVRNERGHYIGAYVYVSVNVTQIDPNAQPVSYPDVTVVHYCTFYGLGFKDLGNELTSEAALLQPRVPGFGAAR